MTSRRRGAGVIIAALIAGLCFSPVFGAAALVVPVGLLCLVAFGANELCRCLKRLMPWRSLLVGVAGLLVVVETVVRSTTVEGVPTAETARALGRGLESWQSTLESTWPARPDADLVLFVPLLVLIACVLGLELLDRSRPLVAALPSLVVIGISQAYVPLAGLSAGLIAAGYAVAVVAMLLPEGLPGSSPARSFAPWAAAVALGASGVAGGCLLGSLDPAGQAPYTLRQVQSADSPNGRLTNPLDEIALRLADPGRPVFRYRSAGPVGSWRLVTLDDFDGVSWTTARPFLRLGTELAPGPQVRVPTTRQQARVEIEDLAGPWLPSQPLPAGVGGVSDPQVEPTGGTLLVADRPDSYHLTWSKPVVDAKTLLLAGVDPQAPGGLGDLGAVPPEIASLAEEARAGRRSTFATALALERYLGSHYKVATSGRLPTGHSWPQLQRFLVDDHVGTSEQFAAAYVALARLSGIPARLVVGFRAPVRADANGWYTVHNGDVLAWPEVAVEGVGWWPLDPAGQADKTRPVVPGSDTDVTEQAREELPPSNEIEDPVVADQPPGKAVEQSGTSAALPPGSALFAALVIALGLVAAWLVGVPLLKAIRAHRRRRRTGSAAVAGAWAEARDRLRAHGVVVTAGMTVRDLATASTGLTDDRARNGLGRVARAVDLALWSGAPAGAELSRDAWVGVRELAAGLRARPRGDRLRAALEVRTLLPRRGGQ